MVTPVFSILDYHEAVAFYINWLGFRIDWEDQPAAALAPIYLQVSRGDIVLHLRLHCGANPPVSRAIAEIKGLPFYHQQLLQHGQPAQQPILEKAFWNEKVLGTEVVDPFGNVLVFYEPVI